MLWPGAGGDRRYFPEARRRQAPSAIRGEPDTAPSRWLERPPPRVYRDLAHPVLLPLLWAGPVPGTATPCCPPGRTPSAWASSTPPGNGFWPCPWSGRLGIFPGGAGVSHATPPSSGYVSVDFYDGCVLYEEDQRAARFSAMWTPTTKCPLRTQWEECGVPPGSWPRRSSKRGRPSMSGPWCTPWGRWRLNSSLLRGGHFQTGPSRKALGNARKKRSLPKGRNDMRI